MGRLEDAREIVGRLRAITPLSVSSANNFTVAEFPMHCNARCSEIAAKLQ
jgi:hypothetical protein